MKIKIKLRFHIPRVLSRAECTRMTIHLDLTLPPNSSSLPEDLGEQPLNTFYLTLLPMRLAMRLTVTRSPVVSYTAVSPLPKQKFRRSILCCAISQVALGGRYPPLCSTEPGSSSATPNEHCSRGHRETSTFPIITDVLILRIFCDSLENGGF